MGEIRTKDVKPGLVVVDSAGSVGVIVRGCRRLILVDLTPNALGFCVAQKYHPIRNNGMRASAMAEALRAHGFKIVRGRRVGLIENDNVLHGYCPECGKEVILSMKCECGWVTENAKVDRCPKCKAPLELVKGDYGYAECPACHFSTK